MLADIYQLQASEVIGQIWHMNFVASFLHVYAFLSPFPAAKLHHRTEAASE